MGGGNGSSAHSVMTGLVRNVRTLEKAKSTFVTIVTDTDSVYIC